MCYSIRTNLENIWGSQLSRSYLYIICLALLEVVSRESCASPICGECFPGLLVTWAKYGCYGAFSSSTSILESNTPWWTQPGLSSPVRPRARLQGQAWYWLEMVWGGVVDDCGSWLHGHFASVRHTLLSLGFLEAVARCDLPFVKTGRRMTLSPKLVWRDTECLL